MKSGIQNVKYMLPQVLLLGSLVGLLLGCVPRRDDVGPGSSNNTESNDTADDYDYTAQADTLDSNTSSDNSTLAFQAFQVAKYAKSTIKDPRD